MWGESLFRLSILREKSLKLRDEFLNMLNENLENGPNPTVSMKKTTRKKSSFLFVLSQVGHKTS